MTFSFFLCLLAIFKCKMFVCVLVFFLIWRENILIIFALWFVAGHLNNRSALPNKYLWSEKKCWRICTVFMIISTWRMPCPLQKYLSLDFYYHSLRHNAIFSSSWLPTNYRSYRQRYDIVKSMASVCNVSMVSQNNANESLLDDCPVQKG